jgi:hypothetical protein
LKFSPFVSNAFPLTKQNSPSINSPLSVQEGFKISSFENTTCSLFRTQRDTNLKFTNEKSLILKIGGGAVLLLWANTFSPFGMNRQKRIL